MLLQIFFCVPLSFSATACIDYYISRHLSIGFYKIFQKETAAHREPPFLLLLKGFSELRQVGGRRLEHQLFGADAVKGHLHQRIAAHGPHADDHARSESRVLHAVAGLQLQ